MFGFKKKQSSEIFPLDAMEKLDALDYAKSDFFFEEALSDTPKSAQVPNRTFVGPVITKNRYIGACILAGIVLIIFIAKSSSLQILHGDEYRELAEKNRLRIHTLPAERGIIYDRNGVILAENQPTFNLITTMESLPEDQNERDDLIRNYARLLNFDLLTAINAIDASEDDFEQIQIAENIPYETSISIIANDQLYPELYIEVGTRRSYITNEIPSLSHVIGYTGIINMEEYSDVAESGYRRFDHIGKQGLEEEYETLLRGEFGKEEVEVDALGNPERIVSKTDPVDGKNLTLTIDSALQKYVEEVIIARTEGTATEKASVIVADPRDGSILALVSWPAFDANDFTSGINQEVYNELITNEDLPLFNRSISGEFPSGSTIKPVYAAAALMEGVITPSTSFISTGGLRIGLWFFPDWRAGGHGVTNVYHAIADSVNTFFYMIGGGFEDFEGLGIERMMEYASIFGFGSQTGIDIPGEAIGFLPSKEWKLAEKGEMWYIGDTYHAAIGQGDFLVTPLQIAMSTSVFANGGNLVTPHLNSEIVSDLIQIVPDDVVRVLQDAMRRTVTYGSATSMQMVPVPVAGKTGTAQWSSVKPDHSWFTGFAPYDDPEIVITVLMEEGGGDYLAVPVARDILMWWFSNTIEE
ncbi:MAG: penicillin-binding protein 2 [Candidatus Uhrbacteria bacterium]|nr:penicillin-binding protein 2 [Candidatus Uhrbacteria bacterium]